MMPQPTQPAQNFPYLDSLNQPQQEAVEALDGPVLVLAGAGTGKTRVLTTRLAHLLTTRKAFPGEIMALTFTNKAALEMRERVSALLGNADINAWWLGTFHSIAARMLRRHAGLVGLESNFTILDDDDQARLLKQLLELRNIDTKRHTPRAVLNMISRWKDRGWTPADVPRGEGDHLADGKMKDIYKDYQERLKILNACDFGDLLLHMIVILKDPANQDILADYHRRFKYLLVDEYQDTNVAQYMWLRLLAQGSQNICCVGDDDQSIYGWRGAEVGNILRFEKDFPNAKTIRLEQNYRSTGHILAAASAVIAHNEGRLGKTLWSDQDMGEKVHVRGVWDGKQEARAVCEDIEDLQRKQVPLNEMAILVRAGFQMREFEERLMTLGIPYRVIGGARFYERMEIRDAIAYLRVIAQPNDDLAFERIINTPKRGLGPATLSQLHTVARSQGIPLIEATNQLLATEEFKPKVKATLHGLMADFAHWREQAQTLKHTDLAETVLDKSGYTLMWKQDKSPEAPGRLENLKELIGAMAEFENLAEFLEHISLVMEVQDRHSADQATLMTLHGAKGLEFDYVFLPGGEEGLFPSQRSMDETGLAGLEEERRLAYVGITRARKRATICHAANRLVYGSWQSSIPSRFIGEIPEDHVIVFSEVGIYGGNTAGQQPGAARSIPVGSRSPQKLRPAAVVSSSKKQSESGFSAGQRVFHQKFGYGTILSVDNNKLDIKFEKAGRKKVMDSFVVSEKEAGA